MALVEMLYNLLGGKERFFSLQVNGMELKDVGVGACAWSWTPRRRYHSCTSSWMPWMARCCTSTTPR